MTDSNKTNTLYKNYKGWGNTHYKRETFEELFRAYNTIDSNSVLTYGSFIPREQGDIYFENIKSLDVGDIIFHKESSYNTVPLIQKCKVRLTPISNNCKDVYAILDDNGVQIKDIIPFDFSLSGIYNYTLLTSGNREIPFGIGDWEIDTNSSLLVFHKETPSDVSPDSPPSLTFFRYVGPKGERTYIDASLLDVNIFTEEPVKKITDECLESVKLIDVDWFDKYKFNGGDKTQGIGLQYNLTTPVSDSYTGDSIKGWDEDSKAQVVSLLSRKVAGGVLFVSNTLENGSYTIQVEKEGICKIDLEGGFVVVDKEPGSYTIEVTDSEDIYCVLLVKQNETNAFDLYKPRSELHLTVKLPVFVDLKVLPPHLKLSTLASYSDDITPQYYGPRVADFVIATEDTVNSKSSDFIVYNKEGFFLSDALDHMEGNHLFLRNGNYSNDDLQLSIEDKVVSGESKNHTIIEHAEVYLQGATVLENITLNDCRLHIEDLNSLVEIKNASLVDVEVSGGKAVFIDCTISNSLETNENATVELFNTYISNFTNNGAKVLSKGNYIDYLNWLACTEDSILDTTTIDFVNNLPETIKLESTYINRYSDNIDKNLYPSIATVPYYKDFKHRVYAKLPDPFIYDEKSNEITIKLDSIYETISLNEKGELQTRFFNSSEIALDHADKIKTQVEEIYNVHEDTVLETERPVNVDEAILDLYWSKAGLVNGKIPIELLPDSVAAGGLALVGIWSFEDNEGKYPTFDDCDLSRLSDEVYSDVQNGWFFIVKASHKEDDPVFPQNAILQPGEKEAEVYTAGDWIIAVGKDAEGNTKWQKLDRSYLDPIYSRLPELAPNSNGENLNWSILDGGTGLLRLSEKTLAEAIRLINEELFGLYPKTPNSIKSFKTVLDKESSNTVEVAFLELTSGGELDSILEEKLPKVAFDKDLSTLVFGLRGASDLPLESYFYTGEGRTLDILFDNESAYSIDSEDNVMNSLIIPDVEVKTIKPYVQFNLGFKNGEVFDASNVKVTINPSEIEGWMSSHTVTVFQNSLKPTPYEKNVELYNGRASEAEFDIRKFYRLEECEIQYCDDWNVAALNTELKTVGGVPALLKPFTVSAGFTISNFAKYKSIYKDSNVNLKAWLGQEEIPITVTSKRLEPIGDEEGSYDLRVTFNCTIDTNYTGLRNLSIMCDAISGEAEIPYREVLTIPNINTIEESLLGDIKNNDTSFHQVLGSTFTDTYENKMVNDCAELTLTNKGWKWPTDEFVERYTIDGFIPLTVNEHSGAFYNENYWRFITKKFTLNEIHDLTGFFIDIEWNEETPSVNRLTGALDNCVLEVLSGSEELPNKVFQDGNKAVPVIFIANFNEGEGILYPGKSYSRKNKTSRRVTFGRNPQPIDYIYVRVGLPKDSLLSIKNIKIRTDVDC